MDPAASSPSQVRVRFPTLELYSALRWMLDWPVAVAVDETTA